MALLPAFDDNYIPVGVFGDRPVIVDPGDAEPVMQWLTELKAPGRPLVLVTHYHMDHVGGCMELRRRFDAEVVGPEGDQERLLTAILREGHEIVAGPATFRVWDVPGHTYNHIAFVDSALGLAFVGDTLFAGGCGRLFSGTAEQLWSSLERIRALPPETLIYCAHEYTESNLAFAVALDPEHAATHERLERVRVMRMDGEATVPTTVGTELNTNIFLRAGEPGMGEKVGLPKGATPVDVFTELRRRKDQW